MINAYEYIDYNLDVFYVDGFVHGVIQQTREEIQGLTVEEILEKFKKRVNQSN